MKRLSILLVVALLVGVLSAVDFEISGDLRARAAMYNDSSETEGSHVDERLTIGFDSQFHKNLSFRAAFEIGNIVWGNGGGAISTNGVNIETSELNISYLIDALDAKVSLGQMYWVDNMGLVMDDFYSGIMFSKEDLMGFNTELAWMKASEGNELAKDDYNVFMAHAKMNEMFPIGMYLFYGDDSSADFQNITLMPYVDMEMDNMKVAANIFVDMQMGADDEMGMGAAVKANMNLGVMEVGADILYAMENGLTTISSYYQNGLYIYGIGKHHDGLNLYWNSFYTGNADAVLSAVANLRMPIMENMTAFGAAGMLQDIGMEVNAGVEYEVIPDMMMLTGYGAYGMHDNETNNYALGTSVKVNF